MKNFQKFNLDKNYYLIIIISILLSSPLLVKGFFVGHDIHNHIFRVITTYEEVTNGQFPPLIGSRLANGFGYSWNIFYSPLSAFIPAFFMSFLPTAISSLKLYIFLTLIISGITMYRFVHDLSKSSSMAIIAAILYLTAPYRLVDIYIRGAMGEILTFVFLPVLFHGLYNLFHDDKGKAHYLTIGFAGILLSHNISALLSSIPAFLYLVIHYKKLRDSQVLKLLFLNAVFSLGISAFYLVPLGEHRLLGNYTVFQPDYMGSLRSMQQHSVYLHQLLFGTFQQGLSQGLAVVQGEMPFTLGLQLAVPLLLVPLVYKSFRGTQNEYLGFLVFGLGSVMATTVLIPWSIMPPVFSFIQFPWRLLMLGVFFLSIVSARVIVLLFKQLDMRHIVSLMMIILVYIAPLISLTANEPGMSDNNYLKDGFQAQSTGSRGTGQFEYLPVKARADIPYLAQRSPNALVVAGSATLTEEQKRGTKMTLKVNSASGATIELPYLYYLGWDVKLRSAQGVQPMEVSESEKGFISIDLPANSKGTVEANYEGTFYTKLAYVISMISLISFLSFVFYKDRQKSQGKKEMILK